MKKKIIIWSAIIVGLIVLVCCINFSWDRWILPAQVERVVFQGYTSCDGPISDTVELTDSEIRKLVFNYNCASYAGEITGDSCTSEFSFTFYLRDGSRIYVGDAHTRSPRIEVSPPHGERYWIKSEALASFAQELIEKYDLAVS